MKLLNKIIITVAASVMISTAAFATPSFEDVDNLFTENNLTISNWAKDEVYDAWVDGLLDSSGLKFNNNLTTAASREDVVEIVYEYVTNVIPKSKLEHLMSAGGFINFKDTNNTKIIDIAKLGIVSGRCETEFSPDDDITREDVATILLRTEQLVWENNSLGETINQYKYVDGDNISEWAKDAVDYFTGKGQLVGDDSGHFYPRDNMSKQEVIIFVNRLFSNKIENDNTGLWYLDNLQRCG